MRDAGCWMPLLSVASSWRRLSTAVPRRSFRSQMICYCPAKARTALEATVLALGQWTKREVGAGSPSIRKSSAAVQSFPLCHRPEGGALEGKNFDSRTPLLACINFSSCHVTLCHSQSGFGPNIMSRNYARLLMMVTPRHVLVNVLVLVIVIVRQATNLGCVRF